MRREDVARMWIRDSVARREGRLMWREKCTKRCDKKEGRCG